MWKYVHMWVQKNINLIFYYKKIGVEVDGGLIGKTCLSS